MSARAASAPGAGVLDRLQVLRSAPTPLRGALAATWTPSPRTGVGPLRVPGPGLQPSSHDTTTTRTDPAGSTLARPDFGPKDGVHLRPRGVVAMNRMDFRLPWWAFFIKRDPIIDAWIKERTGEFGSIAQKWFQALRESGDDVQELMHDGCPVACVADAPVGSVTSMYSRLTPPSGSFMARRCRIRRAY